MVTTIDINRIKEILPHRYPFLLVDRIVSYESGKNLTALKNVSINEPYFPGHFPYQPVMPGVMILEALAQSCAILASLGMDSVASEKRIYLFAGVDKARFKRPVVPGDQLIMDVQLVRRMKNIWKCSGTARVDGALCCAAELMFTYRDI